MTPYRFEAEIALADGVPSAVVRERVYDGVRVTAEWPEVLAAPEIRVALEVSGELESRDAPAYVELFFHDVFLLMNLASPGSFGGTISMSGGDLRVRELSFDARLFAYAAPLATLPLADVIRWYDGLHLGTRQLATDGVAIALVQLLHLACAPEREEESILRLASAADALSLHAPERLGRLREVIARGDAPVIHPMHDEALDPRVEDLTREWIEVADASARLVIAALQERVKRCAA
jgi:hypothetical protein